MPVRSRVKKSKKVAATMKFRNRSKIDFLEGETGGMLVTQELVKRWQKNRLKESTAPAVDMLRELYPHGHPSFIPTLVKRARLHSEKNHSYTHGGPALGNFERVANMIAMYKGFDPGRPIGVALMNMLKHFDKIMWDYSQTGIAHPENLNDASVYFDIINCMVDHDHEGDK